jgi:peptidoglycan/xylan/chitin deacetylase (PgdA/CDA1 family)
MTIAGSLRRVKRLAAPRVKDALAAGGYGTGLYHALGMRYAGRGVILMFHRVCPDHTDIVYPGYMVPIGLIDTLVQSVRRAGWDIIGLDDIPARLDQRNTRRFVCFTFDDGYADNYTLALPVFRQHQAPMAVYIATGFLTRSVLYWWGALEALVWTSDTVDVPGLNGALPTRLPAVTLAEKRAAYDALDELGHQAGERFFDAMQPQWQQAGIDPRALLNRDALTVEQARALAADPLVTIGAHTITHPRLAKLVAHEAEREIAGSRAALEQTLGTAVRHFAYPFGGANACGPREFEMAAQAGFRTAVTTRRGNVFPAHASHLHALPRRNVPMSRRHLLNALFGLETLRRREPIFRTA